jgi:hypothetical protein
MASMEPPASADAQSNLKLLDFRLRRLEFLLTGSSDVDGTPDHIEPSQKAEDNVVERLSKLQDSLNRLRRLPGSAGAVVREVEALSTFDQLSMHARNLTLS